MFKLTFGIIFTHLWKLGSDQKTNIKEKNNRPGKNPTGKHYNKLRHGALFLKPFC